MVDETGSTAPDCPLYLRSDIPSTLPRLSLVQGDALEILRSLPKRPTFDLVVTSPPYNLGKSYEPERLALNDYINWQDHIIEEVAPRVKVNGHICWQVGNYVDNGAVEPLDVWLHPLFKARNLQLRNRVIWRYGHGLHCRRRFSGRYEVVLWYTVSDRYTFNLDAVRIPAKYPRKRHYKGPNAGKYSGHIDGKNPEDVWDIPNVKGNHCEKTKHPCQFPVGLAERLVLALTRKNGRILDPFCGVGSAGVAAALHGRRFLGCDKHAPYLEVAQQRIADAVSGEAVYRPHDEPLYDASTSPLAIPRARRTVR